VAAFFYFFLPEMKNRTLEEIDEMFVKRVATRKFATYECECSRVAHDIVVEQKAEEGARRVEVRHKELNASQSASS